MTLEGCVVRISDMVAYLGKDIEDAIRLNIIKDSDIPKEIKEVLGYKNRELVNTIITDIIQNSWHKNYIKISDKVFEAIVALKKFNYENIYIKAYTKEELTNIKTMFNTLFTTYLEDIKNHNEKSNIYQRYYLSMSKNYQKNSPARIVIDYIAGMTDEYLIKEYKRITKNS